MKEHTHEPRTRMAFPEYTIFDFSHFARTISAFNAAGLQIKRIKLSPSERAALERMSGQTGHCLGYPVVDRA